MNPNHHNINIWLNKQRFLKISFEKRSEIPEQSIMVFSVSVNHIGQRIDDDIGSTWHSWFFYSNKTHWARTMLLLCKWLDVLFVQCHLRIYHTLHKCKLWRRVAEWLEHTTAKQKVAGSNPTRASGWKTPSVHPAVKWVPDLIQGRKGSGRRGMSSAFHMLCPRHSEPLTVRRPNGQ